MISSNELDGHLALVEQRWYELEQQGGIDAINASLSIAANVSRDERERCLERAYVARSSEAKVHWFRQEAAHLSKAVGPIAACRAGCSHCCHIGVSVNSAEAEAIGKTIGRKPATPLRDRMILKEDLLAEGSKEAADARFKKIAQWQRKAYVGVPCTFLRDGRCSIYEYRPLSCRWLWSLDRDALLCKLVSGRSIRVPYVNTKEQERHYLMAFGDSLGVADIRDWFPTRERNKKHGKTPHRATG